MDEEEILGVNLDELSELFSDTGFLGGESFGWGLAPYRNVVMNDEGIMVKDDNVVLYIDALGDANLSAKLWMYKKEDPLDAYDEPVFNPNNLFIKGLSKAIPGVPTYGIIAYPWYEVTNDGLKRLDFPEDTPPGYVPCNGYILDLFDGTRIRLPDLTSITTGSDVTEVTTYFAPPGTTYMMKLPEGVDTTLITSTTGDFFNRSVPFRGELRTWGNPMSPFTGAFGRDNS